MLHEKLTEKHKEEERLCIGWGCICRSIPMTCLEFHQHFRGSDVNIKAGSNTGYAIRRPYHMGLATTFISEEIYNAFFRELSEDEKSILINTMQEESDSEVFEAIEEK